MPLLYIDEDKVQAEGASAALAYAAAMRAWQAEAACTLAGQRPEPSDRLELASNVIPFARPSRRSAAKDRGTGQVNHRSAIVVAI